MAASPVRSPCRTTVDSEDITADYSTGVLKLKLAKRAEAKPKQIKVNIGQHVLDGNKN